MKVICICSISKMLPLGMCAVKCVNLQGQLCKQSHGGKKKILTVGFLFSICSPAQTGGGAECAELGHFIDYSERIVVLCRELHAVSAAPYVGTLKLQIRRADWEKEKGKRRKVRRRMRKRRGVKDDIFKKWKVKICCQEAPRWTLQPLTPPPPLPAPPGSQETKCRDRVDWCRHAAVLQICPEEAPGQETWCRRKMSELMNNKINVFSPTKNCPSKHV